MLPPLVFTPIGVLRTPFADRVSTPRQPYAARGVPGRIELFSGHNYETALSDVETWSHLWVIFCFHLNAGWRAKVLPPRSGKKRRGVFATRAPHRPNPIGMSAVRLVAVRGLTLEILDVDMIDGSPVLDIKPYVPFIDAIPEANTGWLAPLSDTPLAPAREGDPEPGFVVAFAPLAAEQSEWLKARGVDLAAPIAQILALGPQPHPYRRIREEGGGLLLAVKDWRVRFTVEGRRIEVTRLVTGYREGQLTSGEAPEIHREFTARYGR